MRTDWMERAACAHDPHPDDWFAGPGEYGRRKRAVAICLTCPVRAQCEAFARLVGGPGTWGGTSENQRERATA